MESLLLSASVKISRFLFYIVVGLYYKLVMYFNLQVVIFVSKYEYVWLG